MMLLVPPERELRFWRKLRDIASKRIDQIKLTMAEVEHVNRRKEDEKETSEVLSTDGD